MQGRCEGAGEGEQQPPASPQGAELWAGSHQTQARQY